MIIFVISTMISVPVTTMMMISTWSIPMVVVITSGIVIVVIWPIIATFVMLIVVIVLAVVTSRMRMLMHWRTIMHTRITFSLIVVSHVVSAFAILRFLVLFLVFASTSLLLIFRPISRIRIFIFSTPLLIGSVWFGVVAVGRTPS